MKTVNIHEAKTHLSKLVAAAAKGEPFIIAKAGQPLVAVHAIGVASTSKARRIGFLAGHGAVPDDFNRMGAEHIENLFKGKAS